MKIQTQYFGALYLSVSLLLSGCAVIPRGPIVSFKPQKFTDRVPAYRGVIHVHTNHSVNNSKITLPQTLSTTRKAGYDFVVVTDHNTLSGKTAYEQSDADKYPLLIFGNEVSTPDGHVLTLGLQDEVFGWNSTQELIDRVKEKGGWAILAHPFSTRTPWRDWGLKNYDGFEIFNFGHKIFLQNKLGLFMKAAFLSPGAFIRNHSWVSNDELVKWDTLLKNRKVSVVGSSDAHQKIKGLESVILYFQGVTTYVVANQLENRAITASLAEGRCFVAFEGRGHARDFQFWADENGKSFEMGESAKSSGNMTLKIRAPQKSRIRLIHNGQLLAEKTDDQMDYALNQPGVYRAEVYRGRHLWILSNPIYIS